MYFPAWWILVMVSLLVSLAAFVWGMWSGQFADQERARYLPFINETQYLKLPPRPAKTPFGTYYLIGLIIVGLGFFAFTVGLTLYHQFMG